MKKPSPTINWLRVAVGSSIVLAIGGGAWLAVVAVNNVVKLPPDVYASDWTAIFVIEHLRSSGNSWPTKWSDLKDEFDRMAKPSHYAWTFSELQKRVNLRFDVTAEMVRDAEPQLEVFRLTSGRTVSYDGDPNDLIRHYLRTGQGGMESLRTAN